MARVRRLESRSARETERIGAELAAEMRPGDVLLVTGELGAGKTTLVRGASRALGVTQPVTSPTFTIGQRYRADGRRGIGTVSHIDLYRLHGLRDEDPDLLADYIGPDTVSFVEWAEGSEREIEELGSVARTVRLTHGGAEVRTVEIS